MLHSQRSEDVQDLIEIIKQKTNNSALVVEGAKDKRALQHFGIDADFFLLNKYKKSLRERAEAISEFHDQAFLFLDLDPKGRQLTRRMKENLHANRVKVNTRLANKLLKLAKTDKVEGLISAIRKLKRR